MPKSDSKKVFRTVISEQIKEQLMEEIFRHKYKPGERLVDWDSGSGRVDRPPRQADHGPGVPGQSVVHPKDG